MNSVAFPPQILGSSYRTRTSHATEPLDQLFAWQFLDDVQKKETWPGKEAEEASLQRILDANDAYPYDSESDVYEDVDEQRWESGTFKRSSRITRAVPRVKNSFRDLNRLFRRKVFNP